MNTQPHMIQAINNSNADVRKCTVFCLVAIQAIIGEDLFREFMMRLNPRYLFLSCVNALYS